VTNGSLTAESFLVTDDAVSGVLGWHDLRVGDPAADLAWVYGTRDDDAITSVLDAYATGLRSTDRQVAARARLYSELDVAKWLLHGTQSRSTEIVDDAVEMLSALLDTVENQLGAIAG
jgi:macrolide phosphotransferase